MDKFISALDQGTTSSRAIVFDRQGHKQAVFQEEFPQIYPSLDWDEELMSLFGIDRSLLPKVCSCSEIFGHYTRGGGRKAPDRQQNRGTGAFNEGGMAQGRFPCSFISCRTRRRSLRVLQARRRVLLSEVRRRLWCCRLFCCR